VSVERTAAALEALVGRGEIARGGFLPGGEAPELCHADVLRELRRRTLDQVRSQMAPVEPAALGRFLPAWQGVGSRRGGTEALREAIHKLAGAPLPLVDLESRILPARVADYRPEMLDQLGAAGEVVWVGAGRLGTRDGRVALWDRDRLGLASASPPPDGPGHQAILAALGSRGASFQLELESASGLSGDALGEPLWDLVWAGLVTNDTFAPLRGWMRGGAKPSRRSAGSVRHSRFAGGGRWSLVAGRGGMTEVALGRAQLLLDRYGVVSREAALAEDLPGGFAALAPVYRLLEETGRVRRGYFVGGLDGRQFAAPLAIDRLRSSGEGGPVVLAATDPGNPYGALLPWPIPGCSRRSGAVVVLWRGQLAWYWEAGGKSLVAGDLLPDELLLSLREAAPAVARVYRRRGLRVEMIGGEPARTSSLAPLLMECGFRSELRGLGYEPAR
jgi:ATP-dependent Lhr-like helicase